MAELAAAIFSDCEHRDSPCWAVEVVTNKIFGQVFENEELNEVWTKGFPPKRVRVIQVSGGAWFSPEEALAIATILDPQRVARAMNEKHDGVS